MKRIFNVLLPIAIGFMWIYSSVDKLLQPEEFYWTLNNYRLFPDIVQGLAALAFPVFELLLGVMMVLHVKIRETYLITAATLLFFVVILTVTMIRGIDLNCGCFNLGEQNSDLQMRIVFDLTVTALAVLGIILYDKKH